MPGCLLLRAGRPGKERAMKLSRKIRLLLLLAISVAAMVAALPPFPQPQAYHYFAEQRALFGVPNFLNVVSNIPFLVVAMLGLGYLLQSGFGAFSARVERLPYALFFLCVPRVLCGELLFLG